MREGAFETVAVCYTVEKMRRKSMNISKKQKVNSQKPKSAELQDPQTLVCFARVSAKRVMLFGNFVAKASERFT